MLLEPVTSLTDVLLTLLAGGLAWDLYHGAPRPLARRDAYWVNSFTTLAAARKNFAAARIAWFYGGERDGF